MLNLSDKELDRLSKEAAQEYEPGDVLGPNSWEKLETRLDGDLGRVGSNPLRHIRRFPFYYAPALLVLLGISYYYLTKHPPSSASTVTNSITNKIPTNTTNSTPADQSSANPTVPASNATPADTANAAHVRDITNSDAGAAGSVSSAPAASSNSQSSGNKPSLNRLSPSSSGSTATRASSNDARSSGNSPSSNNARSSGNSRSSNDARSSGNSRSSNGVRGAGVALSYGISNSSNGSRSHGRRSTGKTASSDPAAQAPLSAQNAQLTQSDRSADQSRGLNRVSTGGLSAIKTPADISDSALRAFTLKSMPPPPIKRALYITRNWQFGLIASPDFSSVNALAGDKPGSSVGITVDYQFAPRWYIGSALLLDHRNYAARSQDFHPSHSFYTTNQIDSQNVNFVKGSLTMLEIPLNLRYDFSITGNTLFFANVGVSSYLLSGENGNCYVNYWGREVPRGFQSPHPGNYLFSSMNLSLGVETGLSNSLSLLVAPWIKMPLRTIGLGQMQMNSVGITFALKWAPVTSVRRR